MQYSYWPSGYPYGQWPPAGQSTAGAASVSGASSTDPNGYPVPAATAQYAVQPTSSESETTRRHSTPLPRLSTITSAAHHPTTAGTAHHTTTGAAAAAQHTAAANAQLQYATAGVHPQHATTAAHHQYSTTARHAYTTTAEAAQHSTTTVAAHLPYVATATQPQYATAVAHHQQHVPAAQSKHATAIQQQHRPTAQEQAAYQQQSTAAQQHHTSAAPQPNAAAAPHYSTAVQPQHTSAAHQQYATTTQQHVAAPERHAAGAQRHSTTVQPQHSSAVEQQYVAAAQRCSSTAQMLESATAALQHSAAAQSPHTVQEQNIWDGTDFSVKQGAVETSELAATTRKRQRSIDENAQTVVDLRAQNAMLLSSGAAVLGQLGILGEQLEHSQKQVADLQRESTELKETLRWTTFRSQWIEQNSLLTKERVDREAAASKAKLREVERENEKLQEASTCVVCMDRRREVACEPCMHLTTCRTCQLSMGNRCPICQSWVMSTVRVFLP